jgi:hypothetical protein
MSLDPSVEQKILFCIDEALETLGKDGKQTLKDYFQRHVHLERTKIVEEPELFSKRLGWVLGEQSAKALEAWIVRKLVSSFELKGKPGLTLAQAIKTIKAARRQSCGKIMPPRGRYVSAHKCDKVLDERDVREAREDR